MSVNSVSIALVGSGGAGVMTAGQMLLDAAAKAGWYGLMTRSSGPQIRGGEAAAMVRLSVDPVEAPCDRFDIVMAFDWQNVDRFAGELPMDAASAIITDPDQGEVPPVLAKAGAKQIEVSIKKLASEIEGGRVNMIGLGAVAAAIGLDLAYVESVVGAALGKKGAEAMAAAVNCMNAGHSLAKGWGLPIQLDAPKAKGKDLWNISGNEAAGQGAIRAGVRFCAAYPITPATEVLEYLAPRLPKVGGSLVQAEDELASINMCLGGSYGGVPSITATSGPGLSLMTEALGLAVSSEIPVVVVDVMRGGPSTGIPTKSEQSDFNQAVYGLHGDAPHLVLAPLSIADCLFTTQWAVYLAEALQTAAIVLSDQSLGQSRAVVAPPPDLGFRADRVKPASPVPAGYKRYADTPSGVSPMATPGMPGGEYTADGLEHAESGLPSSQAADHDKQLNKRLRKLTEFDYGDHWAEIEGEGEVAVITFGSIAGPTREAVARARAAGQKVKLIAMRLITPTQPAKMAAALKGVKKLLIVEQTHGAQFAHFLRAHYDLPAEVTVFARSGPLPMRAAEVNEKLSALV
ncbi:MAG TPA: 2-oxoacid:acceptor oxidoreductase subunit alpha [Azospirillaceae bacterium]|nr:2-oxoacid:acceptor oxidoreductase subunit alpha [Azospirillaceae bacterium]